VTCSGVRCDLFSITKDGGVLYYHLPHVIKETFKEAPREEGCGVASFPLCPPPAREQPSLCCSRCALWQSLLQ